MAQKLNVDTSIVDYLKSTGQDSSYEARAKLYGSLNLTGGEAGYRAAGLSNASQNIALMSALKAKSNPNGLTPEQIKQGYSQIPGPFDPLTGKPKAPIQTDISTMTPPSATGATGGITDPTKANEIINAGQTKDEATANAKGEPPIRTSTSVIEDTLAAINKAITPTTAKPETPTFAKEYEKALADKGITYLESQSNTLDKQEQDAQAALRAVVASEQAKPVAMGVIEGRISEERRQAQEGLDFIQRQKTYISNQLQTKYKAVETLMKLKDTDYDNASKSYNDEYTKNINVLNSVKGIISDQKSAADKAIDDARANAQIVYNAIQSGGLKVSDMSADQQTYINKLELSAGLPTGFYKTLQNKNPKADIVATTSRTDKDGNKYADVIMRDENGKPYSQSVYLGKEKVTGTDEDTKVIDSFTKDLTDRKALGEEGYDFEAFTKKLTELYGSKIDPEDIKRKVQEYYKKEIDEEKAAAGK